MNKAYYRISTKEAMERNGFARQEFKMQGVQLDVVYQDVISGAKRVRPQLDKMLDELVEGDIVYIVSLDRLSRSTKDLLDIVDIIRNKGAYLVSINEPWLDTRASNPMSDFLLTVMGGMAQLERAMITTRIREGVEAAKERGVRFGRPTGTNKAITRAAKLYLKGGKSMREIEKATGVSKSAICNEVRRLREEMDSDKA